MGLGATGATILGCIIFAMMGLLLYLVQADKIGDKSRPAVLLVLGLLPFGMYCGYVSYQPEDAPHFDGPELAKKSGKRGKKSNPFGNGGDDGGSDYADEAGKDSGGGPDDSEGGTAAKVAAVVEKPLPQEKLNIGEEFQDCLECPAMVVIPAGYYTMGTSENDASHPDYEKPQRRIKIARRLGVGRFEITVGQYATFIRETKYATSSSCDVGGRARRVTYSAPGFVQDLGHPAVCVSWTDANAYTSWLGAKIGKPYRLLSAAEWEYAARATTIGSYNVGEDMSETDSNFRMVSNGTRTIGSYNPNKFKIFDVHGNAAEWVEDCWSDNLDVIDESAKAFDGAGGGCAFRVVKGGSWRDNAVDLRSAARRPLRGTAASDAVGFRVARAVNIGTVVAGGAKAASR